MFRNYFVVAFRNMLRNRVYSLINILGLSIGMGVAILIGLWIHDEISFDRNHTNYDRVGRVIVHHTFNGEVATQWAQPLPLGEELKSKYSDLFENISMTSWNYGHFLKHGETRISREGIYAEPAFLKMVSLKMLKGTIHSLDGLRSIIIDQTLARSLFADKNPIGQLVEIDNHSTVKVTGVYEDLPYNSSFATTDFIMPWQLYAADNDWVRNSINSWGNFSFQTLVQLKPGIEFTSATARIKNTVLDNVRQNDSNPRLELHPMSKWHLYAEFRNGINTGGAIQFVWLFGIIGAFVLLLACINFMNLSTARSEKRAKEVGLRKAIGSLRGQLILQFLGESIMLASIAFVFAICLVQLSLNWFNGLSDKKMSLLLMHPGFWAACGVFVLITGLLAGSYPALYLSSFNPVRIFKGVFRAGRFASIPRKVLVVAQFTVSIALIIGTIIVYRQIIHAKDRPIGYDHKSLVTTYGYPFNDYSSDPKRYDYLKNQLIQTGAVLNMGKTSSPTTGVYSNQSDFEWEGKSADLMPNFAVVWCSHDYGKTIGLQFIKGRDFSRAFASDTAGIVLNEAAVNFMSLKDPIGSTIRYNMTLNLKVIGVVKNVLMESPYTAIRPTVYMIDYNRAQILTIKLNPSLSASQALASIEPVFKKFNGESLFETQFVDEEFNRKFIDEERVGKLASFFAGLAIFISCLGLFGLASFVAEQRRKEIGVRKVLGAPVYRIWLLLSKDFVALVIFSCLLAVPIAWYFLSRWLQQYEYRTEISWWIFVLAGAGALAIALLTVSVQSIRAGMTNVVKSLRTE